MQLAQTEQQTGWAKIWKDNLVVAKFPAYFPLVRKNICTEQSTIQAEKQEGSVSGWQETDATLKLVIREEFHKGAIYKDVGRPQG